MTPNKQRHVLTLILSKLAAQGISSEMAPVHMHPLHEWTLPADSPQGTPPSNAIILTEKMVADIPSKQRVAKMHGKQMVPPDIPLQCITNAPPIMTAANPTKKRTLKNTKQTHFCVTCNIIPGSIPTIIRAIPTHPTPTAPERWSLCLAPQTTAYSQRDLQVSLIPVPGGLQQSNLISQEATNFLTNCVWAKSPDIYNHNKLKCKKHGLDFEQVAMLMVHPTTSKRISSCKKLMHKPATSKIWQTALGKYFGGMAQGDNKTGQKGSNLIFVMTHAQIPLIPKNQTITYMRMVVDFLTPKGGPSQNIDHSHGKLDQLSRLAVHVQCQPHHFKIDVEQCTQHTRSQVHFLGH